LTEVTAITIKHSREVSRCEHVDSLCGTLQADKENKVLNCIRAGHLCGLHITWNSGWNWEMLFSINLSLCPTCDNLHKWEHFGYCCTPRCV